MSPWREVFKIRSVTVLNEVTSKILDSNLGALYAHAKYFEIMLRSEMMPVPIVANTIYGCVIDSQYLR